MTVEFELPNKIRADRMVLQHMAISQSPSSDMIIYAAGSRISDGTSLVSRPIHDAVTQRIRLFQSPDQVRSMLITKWGVVEGYLRYNIESK